MPMRRVNPITKTWVNLVLRKSFSGGRAPCL